LGSRELIEETVRLAIESVQNGWGGPFGAVIVRDGAIVARGQNRVLLTGDVTAHAEIEAIRKAIHAVNPYAPTIDEGHQNDAHLELISAPDGSSDVVAKRSRMLTGYEIYTTGIPCPMCLGAIYMARLDAIYYSCGLEEAAAIGFSDAAFYEELAKPESDRRVRMRQVHPEIGERAYAAWLQKPDRHPY
jgi:tRNA(Arg) A34 adenosine deaminase TadA